MLTEKEKVEDGPMTPVDDPHWPRNLEYRLRRLHRTSLEVKIVLGRTQLTLDELEALGKGSIVETTTLSGQPAEIMVNGTLFGRGEIVVIGDHCSLRVTDMVKPETD
jgi:flagellar motor switch protein FliN/FliY